MNNHKNTLSAILEKQINQEFSSAITGTCSTAKAESDSVLTIDMVLEAAKALEDPAEKPFKDFLIEKGFDPNKDMIIFSKSAADKIGLTNDTIPPRMRNQIKINGWIEEEAIYLMKNTKGIVCDPFKFQWVYDLS